MHSMDDATMDVDMDQMILQRNIHNNTATSRSGGDGDRDGGDERMDDAGREAPEEGPPDTVSDWFLRSFWQQGQPTTNRPIITSVSTDSSGGGMDSREEDIQMEREGDDGDYFGSRTHEPLKRYTGEDSDDDDAAEGQANKRRRVTPEDNTRLAFFNGLPTLSERAQSIVEYSAPSVFAPLFAYIGYTKYAIGWAIFMYCCHFVQCMLSDFGPTNQKLRVKPWIPPLPHMLMDTYIWNHSMITVMLLWPEIFGDTAYWLATMFTMEQQQMYVVVSLKAHYTNHKHLLTKEGRHQMELHHLDCFLLYLLACMSFVLAKIYSLPLLLYFGLMEFNLCPIYITWAHCVRLNAGKKKKKAQQPTSKGGSKGKTTDDKGKDDNNKEEDTDTKKDQ